MAPFVFWMVKGEGPTNVIHQDLASAEREAHRLARENPGKFFYVLQTIAAHRKLDVERIDLTEPEAPF